MIFNAYTAAAALAITFIVFAWLVVWSRRDLWWLRGTGVIAALVGSLVSAACMVTFLGYSTLFIVGYTVPRDQLIDVLGYKLDQGVAIYVMLDVKPEPKMYRLPWSDEKAQKLQESSDDEDSNGLQISTFDKETGGTESVTGDGVPVEGGQLVDRPTPRSVLPAKDGS